MDPRNEPLEQYLDVLAEAVRHYARDAGVDYNDAEDCVADLHRRRLCTCARGSLRAETNEEHRRAWRLANWFLKRWIHDRKIQRAHAPTVSLDQMRMDPENGDGYEPSDPRPAPEQAVMKKVEIDKIALIVHTLTVREQLLWQRVQVDGARLKDLALETGRTAKALSREMFDIKTKIRRALDSHDDA